MNAETSENPGISPQRLARVAGALYAVIIVCGIWSEVAVRSALVIPGDAVTTTANIVANGGMFRLSFAADTVMALSDVALAVLLFWLLRPAGAVLATLAMAFRLIQAALIGVSLLFQHLGVMLATGAVDTAGADAPAMLFLTAHAHGYDLGLIFFGVACVLLGVLVVRSGFLPRWIGLLVMAAGPVYVAGSFIRFVAPDMVGAFAPAYAIPVLAETAFCLWLLIRGVDGAAWKARARSA